MTEVSPSGKYPNKILVEKYVNEAARKTAEGLKPMELILLHSIIYCNEKFKLSPLSITNFYNYQLTQTGRIKPIRTKAWDRSRHQIKIINKRLHENLQEIGQEYYKDLI